MHCLFALCMLHPDSASPSPLRLLVVAVGHEGHLDDGRVHRLAAHDGLELGAQGRVRRVDIGHRDGRLEAWRHRARSDGAALDA